MEPDNDLSLEEVQSRFSRWRQTRVKRTTTPPGLWRDAVSLSPRYSACKIARELGLNLHRTKSKIAALNAEDSDSAFVEVKWDSFGMSSGQRGGGYRIEIHRPDGARLSVDCPPERPVSINSLIPSFLKAP